MGYIVQPDQYKYQKKHLALAPNALFAYYPLNDPTGAYTKDAANGLWPGTYTANVPKNIASFDGQVGPLFTGIASQYLTFYSAPLAAAFPYNEGSVSFAYRVATSTIWADAGTWQFFRVGTSSPTNFIFIGKTAANTLGYSYRSGTPVSTTTVISTNITGWNFVAMTWSSSLGEVKAYLNGIQVGATLTGAISWSGTPISAQYVIGSQTTTAVSSRAQIKHFAIWNTPLSSNIIGALATP